MYSGMARFDACIRLQDERGLLILFSFFLVLFLLCLGLLVLFVLFGFFFILVYLTGFLHVLLSLFCS